jgi:hypothetical protein
MSVLYRAKRVAIYAMKVSLCTTREKAMENLSTQTRGLHHFVTHDS